MEARIAQQTALIVELRQSGQDTLAARVSKKLRNDERLLTVFAGTRLRMELDRVPLWRGDHVEVRQLAEHFGRYLYLPRLAEPAVLWAAVRDGVSLRSWSEESFAYADSFDEAAGRYRGLRCGQLVNVTKDNIAGLLVRPDRAVNSRAEKHQITTFFPARYPGVRARRNRLIRAGVAPDRANGVVVPAKRLRGTGSDHANRLDSAELGDEGFRDAVAQKPLRLVSARLHDGKNRQHRRRGRQRTHAAGQCRK